MVEARNNIDSWRSESISLSPILLCTGIMSTGMLRTNIGILFIFEVVKRNVNYSKSERRARSLRRYAFPTKLIILFQI